MAAPPHQDLPRLGKGPSSQPIPPGAGACITTPSTATDTAGCASSLLTAGSAQPCGALSSARANAHPARGCFLQRPGLESINKRGLLLTAPEDHVRILTSDVKGQIPTLRADPAGLHAGAESAVSTPLSILNTSLPPFNGGSLGGAFSGVRMTHPATQHPGPCRSGRDLGGFVHCCVRMVRVPPRQSSQWI